MKRGFWVTAVLAACALVVLAAVVAVNDASLFAEEDGSELVDIDMGASGSGLDFGLAIPKPTLSSAEVKKLEDYEETRKKLLDVIRSLEGKLAGVSRPLVEVRVALPGVKGRPGPAGPPGKTGDVGAQGEAGLPGAAGPVGPQGPAGAAGARGLPGPPGEPGRRGPVGAPGERGARGQDGERGPQGPAGKAGVMGERGPQGLPGPDGDMGPVGAPGARGKEGAVGAPGPPPLPPGIVRGTIINAMDGRALSGVAIQVLRDGQIVANVRVSNTGQYSIALDADEYVIQGTAPGFIQFRRTVTVQSGVTDEARVYMVPVMQTGELKVVLTWNMRVSDLDLHVDTPNGCHVGWQGRECKGPASNPVQDVSLDVDDTNGNGPETVSFRKLMPGQYKIYVHRYSAGNFLESEATVRIFFPSGDIRTYRIGSDGVVKDGNMWEVATIDGATGNLFGPVAEGTSWEPVPGSPATFTSLSTSQSGLNVWAASENIIYRRTGITDANKVGTGWGVVTGANAVGVAASDLGIWVWDEAGNIKARTGVTATSPEGTAWIPVPKVDEGDLFSVSFDGANAVATTTDGKIWWRAGIVSTNPIGSRWFEVPGRMTYVSVYSNVLWGVRHGKIYRRTGMDVAPPAGTGWDEIPGEAARVTVSNGIVWTTSDSGLVFFRKGISQDNRAGTSWGQLPDLQRVKVVSAGNGVVWGLDTTSSPVFRKGVARTG